MGKLIGAVFAVVMGLVIAIPDAEAARRLGGGKSMGMKRDATPQRPAPSQSQQAQQAAPQAGAPAAAAPAAAAGNRWLGPVAGLMAGGLLGALLFGGAFEGIKLMDIVLILLLVAGVVMILRMLRRPQPQSAPMQYAGVAGGGARTEPANPGPLSMPSSNPTTPVQMPAARYFPTGFDAEGFARQAKQNFVRLQDANDRGDLRALKDVTTADLYRELEREIRARHGATQKTEVVSLDAQVVEVVTENQNYIASVRFSGLMKDDPSAQPESFSELWHLQKPVSGASGWVIAGIQQD